MNNPYRSGTADTWYSGDRGDMWVEYKYIPKIPKTARIVPDLSERQKYWLVNRLAEGRNIIVVVGSPDGAVVIPPERWETGVTPAEYLMHLQSRQGLATWIRSQIGVRACHSPATFLSQPKLSLLSIG
jgi:hypothetical protein